MIEMEPLVLLEPGTIGRNLGFSNALRTGTPERFFCHHDSSFLVKRYSLALPLFQAVNHGLLAFLGAVMEGPKQVIPRDVRGTVIAFEVAVMQIVIISFIFDYFVLITNFSNPL